MGILDDVDLYGDDEPLPLGRPLPATASGDAAQLLQNERIGTSRAVAAWGRLAGRLEAVTPALREGFAILNLDRMLRRTLAAVAVEPSEALPCLLGGARSQLDPETRSLALYALRGLLPLVAETGGLEGRVAARVLAELGRRRGPVSQGAEDDDDEAAIAELADLAREARGWFAGMVAQRDPLFAITDLVAMHGGQLSGFSFLDSMIALPDDHDTSALDRKLERLRGPTPLPRLLADLRRSAPDGGLLSVIDLVVATHAAGVLDVPILTGLVRRELLRRERSYPHDLASVAASLLASVRMAERDLAWLQEIEQRRGRTLARGQAVLLAALAAWAPALPFRLAGLTGVTNSGVAAALAPFRDAGLVVYDGDCWAMAQLPDR